VGARRWILAGDASGEVHGTNRPALSVRLIRRRADN
jgi:hypothetical protein